MEQAPRDWRARHAALMRAQASNRARQAALAERRTANKRSSRMQQVRPWFIASAALGLMGLALFTIGIIALGRGAHEITDALTPVGALFIAMCAAPLVLGLLRMAEPPPTPENRCGRCKFYKPGTENYARGVCGHESQHFVTTSDSTCMRFEFSQRAMVRERLSAAPHILNSPTQA